jgi:O-antigen ligase
MTEIAHSAATARLFDRARWSRLADALVVAVAVSLPWSTSVTGVLIAVWVVALLPNVRPGELAREFVQPACGLPLLLCLLAILGMAWSQATFVEQLQALKGPHKLLALPLLFIQFRRSDKGSWALAGFLASCTALLVVSWFLHVWLDRPWRLSHPPGVPVKDYIVQSVEFLICAFALAHLAIDVWRKGRHGAALGLALLALAFLANMAFVATGRTSLIAFALLLILFGLQRFGLRGTLGVALGGVLFAGLIWASSSYLRERTLGVITEIQRYHASQAETSSGFRLEFWKKSVGFVAEAPIVGHGTGSIPLLFRGAASGEAGIEAAVTGNPHNLTLEIAVQLGLIGVILLYATWMAHFLLFQGSGLASWLGQALVVQTVVGSLFLSYLLGFSTGWIYVFGIGVLGGMAQDTVAIAPSRRDEDGNSVTERA